MQAYVISCLHNRGRAATEYAPVRHIAETSTTGHGTNVITGPAVNPLIKIINIVALMIVPML